MLIYHYNSIQLKVFHYPSKPPLCKYLAPLPDEMIAKFRGNGTPHYALNATHRVPESNQTKP